MYEFEAIGTHWWLERLDGGEFTPAIRHDIERYTAVFDQRYSRFREDSLVTRLARTGQLRRPPKEFINMLDTAQDLRLATNSALTIFVGNSLTNLGYGPGGEQKAPLYELEWDSEAVRTLPGTILDFGGFGKGWLIDEFLRILRWHGVEQCIVNGGGDLYCQSDTPVEFALEDPLDPSKKFDTVTIQRGALAASSIVKRAWEYDGKKQHHIIDPRSGVSSDSGVIASFVLADTALVADAIATALIVRPDLEQTLAEKYHVQTRLIRAS